MCHDDFRDGEVVIGTDFELLNGRECGNMDGGGKDLFVDTVTLLFSFQYLLNTIVNAKDV